MPIFYRKAYEAACRGELPGGLTDDHFDDWQKLELAMLWLPTDEQRCDAVYGNWLMRLDAPGGAQQWDLREHLIQGGGLDANYLAELAQNANDAADGSEAELRVKPEPGWLFVANNGRKVTPLNLIGLCDFFGHFALPSPGVRSIGKFGVGFKSSFRIADEIFVHSWMGKSHFTFRIPITVPGRVASHPNKVALSRVLSQLATVGVHITPKIASVGYAGFCTPEYVAEPPPDVAAAIASLATTPQGTIFCYHLHDEGAQEVTRRIESQTENIYELCPLFVPCLRAIELGSYRMAMSLGQEETIETPTGQVRVAKSTLSVGGPEGRQSHVRFWRLVGANSDDKWQLALHADASFRLQVRRTDDGQAASVRDGSAYAFFPLHDVVWPLKLHLHLDLPTSLSRGDWAHGNFVQSAAVEEQIRRAVSVMSNWLTSRDDLWHPEWRVESLLEQTPTQDQKWPRFLWQRLCENAQSVAILRCLWGGRTTANSRTVRMISRDAAHAAWCALGESLPQLRDNSPLTQFVAQTSFGQSELKAADIAELFEHASSLIFQDDRLCRAYVSAFLSCHAQTINSLEQIMGPVPVRLATGTHLPLQDLLQQPAGAELVPEWHATFREIASWADETDWRNVSVFKNSLRSKLKELSQPQFNPTWADLPNQLANDDQWKTSGERFWNTPRSRCPVAARLTALTCIRVPNQNGDWLPIADLWHDDDSGTECFGGLLARWDRSWTDAKRKDITEKLKEWGLWDSWEQSAKTLLKEKLPGVLARRLAEHSESDAFAVVFDAAFESSRRVLDDGWKHIVREAEKTSVSRLLTAQTNEVGLNGKTVVSRSVADPLRAALGLLPEYVTAPPWLTDSAYQRITNLGLQSDYSFKVLSQIDVAGQHERLARELLEKFYQWQPSAVSPTAMTGLGHLSATTSLTKRREWQVGLGPQKPRRLRDLIVPTSTNLHTNSANRLLAMLLSQAKWDGEDLPATLVNIVSLAEACIQPDKLEVDQIQGILTPLDYEQLPTEALALADFKEIVDAGGYRLLGCPRELNLRWRYEGDIVARLEDALFAIEAGRIIVHRYRPPADEEQCQRVLNNFETYATVSDDYKADAVLSPFERYQKHREAIRKTLLKELVAKVGYEKHHILRELLQNAESAYASKLNPPSGAWFEFSITSTTQAGQRKINARHAGRAFNEPDNTGHARHDVERIWRLAAENERTADEVGRFNRGFKTLFTVATNGSVHIRSGDFDFEVIDLLLLKPANPQRNPAKHSPLTEFTFESDYQHALEILKFEAAPGPASNLRVVNAATFIFLSHLHSISVKFEQQIWQWIITRSADLGGWKNVSITRVGTAPPERFMVFSGATDPSAPGDLRRRYAAAVRLDEKGLPTLLEKAWRKFHLTFETDHDFPLDFLVNGDFDADQGRVSPQNIANSGLVELAYEAIVQRAESEIRKQPTCATWLAWARIMHLKEAAAVLNASSELRPLLRHAQKAAENLCAIVPHDGRLVAASSLEFPSFLFRRLGVHFGKKWYLNQAQWIDADIAAALPEAEYRTISFIDWIISQKAESQLLHMVDSDLKSSTFTNLRLPGPEKLELDKAKIVLAEKLRPVTPPPPPEPEFPVIEAMAVEDLWHWWHSRRESMSDYTLEGTENWRLLYGNDTTDTKARPTRLKEDLISVLSTTPSPAGLSVWYRLFGLACLMAAGRRMTEVRSFWKNELNDCDFWNKTSVPAFGQATDDLFQDVTTRPFTNLKASGENAYFWRRVFYDIRKIHRLVWEDHFPKTLLELVNAGRGNELLNFLKTGHLPGQKAWEGVFGQSAGAPLFFIIRELCRLDVIQAPEVKHLAFFVSTPVRRAMERIGWLEADAVNRIDFESLASISNSLYRRIAADPKYGPLLLPDYDIPLLHLGLNGNL